MSKRKMDIKEMRAKLRRMQEEMAALAPLLDEGDSTDSDSDESTSSSVLAFRALNREGNKEENKENSGGNQQPTVPSPKKSPVDPEVLDILGINANPDVCETMPIDDDLLKIWRSLINKGIPRDEKEKFLTKYKRLPELQAKRLNAEVSASLAPKVLKKDAYMADLQNLAGPSLMALGSLITQVMSDQECDKLLLLKSLSDVVKMTIVIHHSVSVSRKANIYIPDLTPQVAEIIKKAEMDDTLHGNDLGDRIKESKALTKLSQDIKQKPATDTKRPFLFKGPQQRQPFSTHTGNSQGTSQSQSRPAPYYKSKQQFFSGKTRPKGSNSSHRAK